MRTIKKFMPLTLPLVLGATLLFAFATTAGASLGPVGPRPPVAASDDVAIANGAPGANYDQDNFRPPVDAAKGDAPCLLLTHIFDKTRLAEWCPLTRTR